MKKISRRMFLKGLGITAAAAALAGCQYEDVTMLYTNEAIGKPGTQIAVVEGYEWGPAVMATILILPEAVRSKSVTADKFSVVESKESFDWATFAPEHIMADSPRQVLEAVTVTPDGKVTSLPSKYILLTLAEDPNTGSPFCFDMLTQKATRCDPYQLHITLNAPLETMLGEQVTQLNIDPNASMAAPCLEDVDLNGVFTGSEGHTLHYASYCPAHPAGEKHPLVIWLHGAGEGGEDPTIAVLGNQVSVLFGSKFQSVMGGAYVLVPQTPTYWMCYVEGSNQTDNPGVSSIYHRDLMELIQHYVDQNPDIDPNRIIVGGCSNGGYMTMDLVLHEPNYFAAAYPICEAYLDAGISDKELHNIVDTNLPIWFIYAQTDTTVPPAEYSVPTMSRLAAMGANMYSTVWPNVVDTTGRLQGPNGGVYEYNGHFSWIYFFQGLCKDDATGVDMWTWMAQQHR